MVGDHASGLKWYSIKNYTVRQGEPLDLNYSFLDLNSTDRQSDVKQEQYIVEMDISNKEFIVNTHAFKYDTVASYNTNKSITEIYTYKKVSDITGDGKITLADLSIVLAN